MASPVDPYDPQDMAKHALPITISSANCVALTGLSWKWVTRFCREHGVPMLAVGVRKRVVPGAALAAAMQRVAATRPPQRPLSDAEEMLAAEAQLRERLRRQR